MDFKLFIGFVSVIVIVCIFFKPKWGSAFTAFSIFLQRLNVLIMPFFKSVQVVFLILPFLTVREMICILKKLKPKENKLKLWISNIEKWFSGEFWLNMVVCLLFADICSFITAYNYRFAIWGLLGHLFIFSMFLSIYWMLKRNNKHLNYLVIGALLGGLTDLGISLYQMYDCWNNRCIDVSKIYENFSSKALSLEEQSVWVIDRMIPRSMGLFGDVNIHGFMIGAVLIILSGLIFSILNNDFKIKKKFLVIITLLALLILFSINLLFTLSRSAILSFLCTFAIFLCVIILKTFLQRKNFKNILLGLAILFGILSLGLFLYVNNNHFHVFIKDLLIYRIKEFRTEGSSVQHFVLIKESLKIGFKDTFGLGAGIGNYSLYYRDFYEHSFKFNQYRDPHSWIGILVGEQGTLGLLFYSIFFIFLVGKAFVSIFKNLKNIKCVELGLLLLPIMFLSGMVVYYGLFTPMVWFWFGISAYLSEKYNDKI